MIEIGVSQMAKKKKEDWVTYDRDEINNLVVKLAKEGHTAAKIGLILRDQYGIPDVKKYNIRISRIARNETKQEIPEDLFSLLKKTVNLHRHLSQNRKDPKARHSFQTIEDKVRKLARYYVKEKKLPKDWEYTIEKAKLLVK